MIDDNGVYTKLPLDTAIGNQIALAEAEGITVTTGSVEQQLVNMLAQNDVYLDNKQFQSYQLQFNPVGSDIDLQNPGTPRLQAGPANGYWYLVNDTGDPIEVPIQTILSAPNGNQYSTLNNSAIVPANDVNTIPVQSVLDGIDQNLPSNQTFDNSLSLTITNPQPFSDGRDVESDTAYLDRIIYLQTNNSSQQATAAWKKEIKVYYQECEIYVNNSSTENPNPVPIPPNGYIAIVLFPSGKYAGPAEIQRAMQITANRLEFGNTNANSTDLHPVLGATIYSGPFPQNFYLIPAQSVESTLNATITVSFLPNIDESEKNTFAVAFAQKFAQNIVNYFGGAAGNATCNFQLAGSPPPDLQTTEIPILADPGIIQPYIAPTFSIEQIRALISDEQFLTQFVNLQYLSCDELSLVLDPLVMGETPVELNIDGSPGTISVVDFKVNALFSDYTAWYDRYVYIDPALITININEL